MSISEINGQAISQDASTRLQGLPDDMTNESSSTNATSELFRKDTIEQAEGAEKNSCGGGESNDSGCGCGGGSSSGGGGIGGGDGGLSGLKKLLEKLLEALTGSDQENDDKQLAPQKEETEAAAQAVPQAGTSGASS